MHRKYDDGSSLHKKIIEGVDILADNVASTLGPKGRNVLLINRHLLRRMVLQFLGL